MRQLVVRRWWARGALVATASALACAIPAGPAFAAPAAPQLSIAIDNGRATAAAGDRLNYTVTVTNLGTAKVKGVRLSQTVPSGATPVGGSGKLVTRGAVRWTVDLPATKSVTLHSTLRVAATPPADLLRLATVACAQVSARATPLVCAADSDLLPAGAAAQQVQSAATDRRPSRSWWYAGGGLALAAAAVAAAFVLRRRRRVGGRRRAL